MNKKVLTLCAGFLLAGNAVAFAQTEFATSTLSSASSGYAIQKAFFEQDGEIYVDESDAVGNPLFPAVSPFAINTTNGAKPITELTKVNDENGNTPEDKYFQFVVSDPNKNDQIEDGREVLTMVWVNDNGTGNQGHYELQVEDVNNANIPDNRIILDRTLWKVTVKKETSGAGTTLYYTLQNKATDAIMQMSYSGEKPAAGKAIELQTKTIVAGQTQWRWAEGENATVPSANDDDVDAVLQGVFSAQFDNGTTLVLAGRGDGTHTVVPILINSNDMTRFMGCSSTSGFDTYYYPITFEAWEANPIILTAD